MHYAYKPSMSHIGVHMIKLNLKQSQNVLTSAYCEELIQSFNHMNLFPVVE